MGDCCEYKETQAFYHNLVYINVLLQSLKLKQSIFFSHVIEINAVNKCVYWEIYFGVFLLSSLQAGMNLILHTLEIQQSLYYPSVSLLQQCQVFNQNRLNCTACSKDQYEDMISASFKLLQNLWVVGKLFHSSEHLQNICTSPHIRLKFNTRVQIINYGSRVKKVIGKSA